MTQAEFLRWIESVFGDMPMDEFIAPEVREHMDRIQVEGEARAWMYAKEEAREPFEIIFRSVSKTLFAIGYSAGREQAQIDAMLGSSASNHESHDDTNSDAAVI